jgi:hypothetical protein
MPAMLTLCVWHRRRNSLWSGTEHEAAEVPVLLAGGLVGTLRTGRVLDYGRIGDERPNICGMYLGIMDRVGVKLDRCSDASERLAGFRPVRTLPGEIRPPR